MKGSYVLAAALAGAATGLRSTTGVGALVETSSAGLPAAAAAPVARVVAGVAVGGELVVDKLPNTPSRLDPPGFAARLVLAAVSGVVLARAARRAALPAVVVAATAAAASARLGHDLRVRASEQVPPLVAAVAEDAVAITLAVLATQL